MLVIGRGEGGICEHLCECSALPCGRSDWGAARIAGLACTQLDTKARLLGSRGGNGSCAAIVMVARGFRCLFRWLLRVITGRLFQADFDLF